MELAIIAAYTSKGRVIGKDNKLVWNIPADLARFKKLTSEHFCIVGRKTFQSLPSLPNRTLIVLTSEKLAQKENVFFVSKLDFAFKICKAHEQKKVFCIGGAEIYKLCFPFASTIYITEILKEYEGDSFFPPFNECDFIITEKEIYTDYIFKTYRRKNNFLNM